MISAGTHRLIEGLFDCASLGAMHLKGFPEPVVVWQVHGESTAESRFDALHARAVTPMVGRDREFGLLMHCWERVGGGEAQVALISGEAGVGKSRILHALRTTLEPSGPLMLTLYCSPYHQASALHPVINYYERLAGIAHDDSQAQKLAKLETAVGRERCGPGADGADRGDPAVDSARRPLRAAGSDAGAAEGADPASAHSPGQGHLAAKASALPRRGRALDRSDVVGTALAHDPCAEGISHASDRDVSHAHGEFPAAARDAVDAPAARPARPPAGGGVAAAQRGRPADVAKGECRDHRARRWHSAVCRGIEQGRDGVRAWRTWTATILRCAARAPEGVVPATLHDSLMARLDRMSLVKPVAQFAAVLGRVFTVQLLSAAAPRHWLPIDAAITALASAEIILPVQQGANPTYQFKHALLQDVAYQSLLRTTRREYHARIAHAIAEQFRDIAETQPEIVARHFTEAGLPDKAVDYWLKAGQRSTRLSSNLDAISHFERGLALVDLIEDPVERMRIEYKFCLALVTPLIASKGYTAPELERIFERALRLSEELGDTEEIFPVLYSRQAFELVGGQFDRAAAHAEEAIRLAKRNPLADSAAFAGRLFATLKLFQRRGDNRVRTTSADARPI